MHIELYINYDIIIVLLLIYNYKNIICNIIKLYSLIKKNLSNNKLKKDELNKIEELNKYYIVYGDNTESTPMTYNEITSKKFEYNMILYKKSVNKTKYNLIRYNNYSELIDSENKDNSEVSNVRIINPVLKINEDKVYKLKISNCNYMLVENIIYDRIFLKWFMLKYYNYILNDDDDYKVQYINSGPEIRIIELSKEKSIYLEKDGYRFKVNN